MEIFINHIGGVRATWRGLGIIDRALKDKGHPLPTFSHTESITFHGMKVHTASRNFIVRILNRKLTFSLLTKWYNY